MRCNGLKPRTQNLAVHSCHVVVSRASVAFVVVCVTTWMHAICYFQKITDVRPFVFVIQLKKLTFLWHRPTSSKTRKETSYSDRKFWCSYILSIIIIGGLLVLFIQCVPLVTEPGISLIILNLKRNTFVVWEMKRNVSVARLIVATRRSGPPASQPVIKEMPGSVASGTPYIYIYIKTSIKRSILTIKQNTSGSRSG
jgi:hypothetical protein